MKIVPYKSASSIEFGCDSDHVMTYYGEPHLVSKDRSGNSIMRYDRLNVTVAQLGVVEVELFPDTFATLEGIDIFSDPKAFSKLCTLDGDPHECVGAILLLKLGISMTGFHNQNDNQKTVSVFTEGRWTPLMSRMQKYQFN